VFYDGECGFCNRAVTFILAKDQTTSLCFASIQSEFAQNFFTSKHWEEPDLSTFYFYEDGVLYEKSTGALRLLNYFSRSYKLLKVFWLVPVGIRDWIYNAVAKRRERLSSGYCILPTSGQRDRFLD